MLFTAVGWFGSLGATYESAVAAAWPAVKEPTTNYEYFCYSNISLGEIKSWKQFLN